MAVIVVGVTMVAAALCLPLLMGITLVHIFISHDDTIDSSIMSVKDAQDLDLLVATAWEDC